MTCGEEFRTDMRRTSIFCVAAVLLLGVGSCGIKRQITTRTRALFGGEVELRVRVAPNANLNNPIAVEVLLVYDDVLLEMLAATNANMWFMNRSQFRQDYPEGFDAWYWEWVPGQEVLPEKLPLKAKAKAILVFANYVVGGDHRARLDSVKSATLVFGERSFAATQD